tara:strand:+ start:197 stop:607 length:411 start_codon:yes stop_codon:yes gene_type:complete
MRDSKCNTVTKVDINAEPMTVSTVHKINGFPQVETIGALVKYRYASDKKWESRVGYVSFGEPTYIEELAKDKVSTVNTVEDTFGVPDDKIVFYTNEQELVTAIKSHQLGYKGLGMDQEFILQKIIGFNQKEKAVKK